MDLSNGWVREVIPATYKRLGNITSSKYILCSASSSVVGFTAFGQEIS